jgi:hypothetical protein
MLRGATYRQRVNTDLTRVLQRAHSNLQNHCGRDSFLPTELVQGGYIPTYRTITEGMFPPTEPLQRAYSFLQNHCKRHIPTYKTMREVHIGDFSIDL